MFKGVNKTAVFEIAFGVLIAIALMNILGSAFGRVPILGMAVGGHLEDAEDAEHWGGGRERRRARRAGRKGRRKNRRRLKLEKIRHKFADRQARDEEKYGYQEEEPEEEPQEQPDYEEQPEYEEEAA